MEKKVTESKATTFLVIILLAGSILLLGGTLAFFLETQEHNTDAAATILGGWFLVIAGFTYIWRLETKEENLGSALQKNHEEKRNLATAMVAFQNQILEGPKSVHAVSVRRRLLAVLTTIDLPAVNDPEEVLQWEYKLKEAETNRPPRRESTHLSA